MQSSNAWRLILWAAATICPAQTITIHVYDYAGLPAGKWTETAAMASQVLNKAGYPVEWLACKGADARPDMASRCEAEMGDNDYILRIVGGKGPQARGNVQALAHALVDHANGGYATVFLEPIQAHAASLQVSTNTLLACASAHEVVHLLRGPKHSSSGLMKAGWDRHDAASIAQLNLPLR